jgi:hypothetical protein
MKTSHIWCSSNMLQTFDRGRFQRPCGTFGRLLRLYRLSSLSYDSSWDAGDRRRRIAALPPAGLRARDMLRPF